MPADDREQQFERALARLLRDASPESHCPDPETISAYHERTLPLEQMAFWKEHIAGCVRCQEILTLVEQSEDVPLNEWRSQNVPVGTAHEEVELAAIAMAGPETLNRAPQAAPASARSFELPVRSTAKPRVSWRWLVPVGAVAAAAILVVGIREFQSRPAKAPAAVQMAKNQAPTTEPSLAFPSAVDKSNQQATAEEAPVPAESTGPAKTLEQAARDRKASPAVPPAPSVRPAASTRNGALPLSTNDATAPAKKDTGKGYTSAEMERQRELDTIAENAKTRDLLIPPAAPAPRAAAGIVANAPAPAPEAKQKAPVPPASESVEVQTQAPGQAARVESNSNTSKLAMHEAEATNFLEVAALDSHYILAPDAKSLWRVGAAGKIERSSDHGKTWQSELSGVTADLTAGAAPSDKICWVVGKAGTVLLTTDGGKHWKQVASPTPNDLAGVHAIDAAHASIWDISNRATFETSDGGLTWNRAANE